MYLTFDITVAIIIGVYDNSMSSGKAANIVEKLGDYLRANGQWYSATIRHKKYIT